MIKNNCLSFFILLLVFSNAYADQDHISVTDAYQKAKDGEIVLIDIRSEKEWHDTGVAPQSALISMHQQGGIPKFSNDLSALLDGDKSKPIALICAGGVRSAYLQSYLKDKGYTQVLDVNQGMVGGLFKKGWVDHELPTVSPSTLNDKAKSIIEAK